MELEGMNPIVESYPPNCQPNPISEEPRSNSDKPLELMNLVEEEID